eukprot:COSAG06_NODE_15670_length_1054_cov_1.048168_1_plen_112_part_00
MAATTLSTWLAPADHGHPPASAPMAQKQQHHDDEAQDRDPVSPPESPLKPLAKDRSDNTFGKELAIASLSLEDDDESFPGKPARWRASGPYWVVRPCHCSTVSVWHGWLTP